MIDVDNHLEAELAGNLVAERDHVPEFPRNINVQERKRQLPPDRTPLTPEAKNRRILADRTIE
jgi:hypothetical protein